MILLNVILRMEKEIRKCCLKATELYDLCNRHKTHIYNVCGGLITIFLVKLADHEMNFRSEVARFF